MIYEAVDPNANIIFGALIDKNTSITPGEIAITVIATGFPLTPTEITGSNVINADAVHASHAVKKAAQQVETQAELLKNQLQSNRVSYIRI